MEISLVAKWINKSVSKFAIGAMELKDVVKYLSHHTLLIVGNRPDVQLEALKEVVAYLLLEVLKRHKKLIMLIIMIYQSCLQIMIHFL